MALFKNDSFVIDSFQKNELAGVYNAAGNFAHKNAKLPKSAQGLARGISQSTYKRTGKVVNLSRRGDGKEEGGLSNDRRPHYLTNYSKVNLQEK